MFVIKSIIKELKTILRTAAYFATVFLLMMVMKKLYLEDYDIEFTGISQALIGALILSKVVILMDLISLGSQVQHQPPFVDTCLRTVLYTSGVWIVVILEKLFERRHDAGGIGDSISYLFGHRDIYHVWATTIGIGFSIFIYNAFAVVQRRLGRHGLAKLFFHTPLEQVEHTVSTEKTLNRSPK
jgi:hypothetical protein